MLGLSDADGERLGYSEGLSLGLSDADGLKLADSEGLSLGLSDAEGERLADSDGLSLGLSEAEGDKLGDSEAEGERLGDSEAEGDKLGDSEADGLRLGDSEGLSDGDGAEALSASERSLRSGSGLVSLLSTSDRRYRSLLAISYPLLVVKHDLLRPSHAGCYLSRQLPGKPHCYLRSPLCYNCHYRR